MSTWEAQWIGPWVVLEERACTHMSPKNRRVWVSVPPMGSSLTPSETLTTITIASTPLSSPKDPRVYSYILRVHIHLMNFSRSQIHSGCQ